MLFAGDVAVVGRVTVRLGHRDADVDLVMRLHEVADHTAAGWRLAEALREGEAVGVSLTRSGIGWTIQRPRPRHVRAASPDEQAAFKKNLSKRLPRSAPAIRTR